MYGPTISFKSKKKTRIEKLDNLWCLNISGVRKCCVASPLRGMGLALARSR